jgi:cytochrome bd-type quinol oxidase subunit 1
MTTERCASISFLLHRPYHDLSPSLTTGLALLILILILNNLALRTADEHYNRWARFWARCLGFHFALGILTGMALPAFRQTSARG